MGFWIRIRIANGGSGSREGKINPEKSEKLSLKIRKIKSEDKKN
jgi:hypothetical protein